MPPHEIAYTFGMSWEAFGWWTAGQAVRFAPRAVAKRLFKLDAIKKQLEFDLAAGECVRINTTSQRLPEIEIFFRVCNKSHFPVVIDRILFDVYIGQTIARFANLMRIPLAPGQSHNCFGCRDYLNEQQVAAIRELCGTSKRLTQTVQLNSRLYVDCELGSFEAVHHPQLRGECVMCN